VQKISPSTNGKRAKEKPPGVGGLSVLFPFHPGGTCYNSEREQQPN